jgi:SAM-dependent methyltransferase
MTMTATYSPEDNKLRLYASSRLEPELYKRVHAAGFRWAPKQELFVCPMWRPSAEDLLVELCGEVGDEDTSLVDRAEARAERFEGYQERRAEDADRAHAAVHAICDGIPLGQPILVGHHSERHARKDAERIDNGMRKAVKMWETSEYWKRRAAGAVHAAKYKELPQVRARRIKGIEADKRREERRKKEAEMFLELWADDAARIVRKDADGRPIETTFLERARYLCGRDHISKKFSLEEYPRPEGASKYEDMMSLWSALGGSGREGDQVAFITAEQARDIAVRVHERTIASCNRWIAHYENRLVYEVAMLEEQGAGELLKPKPRPKQLPICNYRAPEGLDIPNVWRRGELERYPQVEMTQAEYAKIGTDYKGTHVVGGSHRVRTCVRQHARVCVFLTDSKVHAVPEIVERKPVEAKQESAAEMEEREHQENVKKLADIERQEQAGEQAAEAREPEQLEPEASAPSQEDKFSAMREQLKAGVKVVGVPQLFPTPMELARLMVAWADIRPEHRVLEPSAGTGNILKAIGDGPDKVAVEINYDLVRMLASCGVSGLRVVHGDFLEWTSGDCQGGLGGLFDRVVMNPPFENGQDIRHIRHAWEMLKPGGRLVAVCAGGPRQERELRPRVEAYLGRWEPLPAGTFKDAGTSVNTVLMMMDKPRALNAAGDGYL